MIDWGCHVGPCCIPLRIAEQLHLTKVDRTKSSKFRGICQFYSPIRVELTDDKRRTHWATMEPFVSPHSAELQTWVPARSVGHAPPGAAIIEISPVKLPIPHDDLETPLLGPAAFDLLDLGFDSKRNSLYAKEEEYEFGFPL